MVVEMAEDPEESEVAEDGPLFHVSKKGSTLYFKKNTWTHFGDFHLKFIGELTNDKEGYWVCRCGAKVLGIVKERTIVIPVCAFDSKVKFLEETRKSFGGGTFSIHSGPGILEKYHNFLKEEYYNHGTPKKYFAAKTIGLQKELLQSGGEEYWCLSREVQVYKGKVLDEKDHSFLFLDTSCQGYEVEIREHALLEDEKLLYYVSKSFIENSSAFGNNSESFKLATAFLLLRLLTIHSEESWGESSIGLLYSEKNNVGKSLTMDILAKGQGVPRRRHSTMLAGGDQNLSGVSVPVIRDTLSKTTSVVMLDDPKISDSLNELFVQLQGGMSMGSRTAGVRMSVGSLLLSSNTSISQRAEGRVLVFRYTKGESPPEEDNLQKLKNFVKKHTGFLLAWAITHKNKWEELCPKLCRGVEKVLRVFLQNMQPRWYKGMASVISTKAIFHGSAGVNPCLEDTIKEIVSQNKGVAAIESFSVRLQRSIVDELENDRSSNALKWINPNVNAKRGQSRVPAFGIVSDKLHHLKGVSMKEITDKLKAETDQKTSGPIIFATVDFCTYPDVSSGIKSKTKQRKGWKIPKSFFQEDVVCSIEGHCGFKDKKTNNKPPQDLDNDTSDDQLEFEEYRSEFDRLDQLVLDFFKDDQYTSDSKDDKDDEGDFSMNLSPRSKEEWAKLSPRSRNVFKKGFHANPSNVQGTKRQLNYTDATPSTSSYSPEHTKVPQKRLRLNEGTTEVCRRYQDPMRSLCGDESEDSVGDNEAEEEEDDGNDEDEEDEEEDYLDPTELIFPEPPIIFGSDEPEDSEGDDEDEEDEEQDRLDFTELIYPASDEDEENNMATLQQKLLSDWFPTLYTSGSEI